MQHTPADLGLNLILPPLTFHRAVGSWRLGRCAKLAAGLLWSAPGGRDTPTSPAINMSEMKAVHPRALLVRAMRSSSVLANTCKGESKRSFNGGLKLDLSFRR